MSHEIESMLYVGQEPWHKLGIKLDKPPTTEEALKIAALDWQVKIEPLILKSDGRPVDNRATVRSSDNSILGVVGPEYEVLQNADAFKFFDPFIQSGQATLETAGSLREGRRIWILAKIGGDNLKIVEGDEIQKYLLLAHAHDGSLAIRTGFTPIRVVCANTLAMAVEDKKNTQLLRILHRGNVIDTLGKVQEIINLANKRFEATAEQYRYLASKQISRKTLEEYVTVVFQQKRSDIDTQLETLKRETTIIPVTQSGFAPAEVESKSKVFPKIVQLFENGKGTDIQAVRGTYWNAYNAVTEYLQHQRGNDDATRLDAAWFGTGMQLNKRALNTAVELAKAA